jgi:DNA-binding response OmpR family regulator
MKVLISDDDQNLLDSMVRYLERYDIEVHGFLYNDLAMNDLEAGFTPDFILTDYDYGCGRRNGVDYIKALRSKHFTVPIALVSGSSKQQLMKEIEGIDNVVVIEKSMNLCKMIFRFLNLNPQ